MNRDIRSADERSFPEALAAMEAVMARPAFTYREVHEAGDAALPKGSDRTCYRWADRLLQRERHAGRIKVGPKRNWVSA